ncbi:metallo-hydrolase/oxidoreductase superfamily protein [Tanacetum coccineum]
MATYKVAVILTNKNEFVITKQTPPPKFNDHEYDSYADSDLWDLPSAKLTSLSPESDLSTRVLIQGQDTCLSKVDLTKFDFRSALNEVRKSVDKVDIEIEHAKKLKALDISSFSLGFTQDFERATRLDQPAYIMGPKTQKEVVQDVDRVVAAISIEKRVNTLGIPSFSLGMTQNMESAYRIVVTPIVIKGKERVNAVPISFVYKWMCALVLGLVGFGLVNEIEWKFLKFVEEPNFGPGYPVETVYVTGEIVSDVGTLKEHCQWSCKESCLDLLLHVKPGGDRVGPFVVEGLLKDSVQSDSLKLPLTLSCQEYPPGVNIVPMGSRTAKPFLTTNLIVFAPGSDNVKSESGPFVAQGDAMIVDPGCRSEFNKELAEIVAALPRKLIVYVTHHHRDHVDGLSTVQKTNPDACLLVHENTMNRISKDDWSGGCTTVSGTEEICIGGERLRIIFAPGHTDGHLALLHVSTNSLIVGDHCVGQGSAFLDINSGGNMSDYFQSSYKLIDLSPNALISMHGRVNLWPKHMLCGYLKNRRNREDTILKAIEAGSNTLFDIVAYTYADVDRAYWIPAASNVRLHVDHLAHQNKLPAEFSQRKFQSTCTVHFFSGWIWSYLKSRLRQKNINLRAAMLLGAVTASGIAMLYSVRNNLNSR